MKSTHATDSILYNATQVPHNMASVAHCQTDIHDPSKFYTPIGNVDMCEML